MRMFCLILLLSLVACKDKTSDINPMNGILKGLSENSFLDADTTSDFMELVNNHRLGLGLPAFIISKDIEDVALKHSENMANKTVVFGHTGSTARCDEIKEALGGGNLCGEVVAVGQKTAQAVFDSWMGSASHRQKIESTRYTHTGLGYAKNLAGTIYWTQMFLEL